MSMVWPAGRVDRQLGGDQGRPAQRFRCARRAGRTLCPLNATPSRSTSRPVPAGGHPRHSQL